MCCTSFWLFLIVETSDAYRNLGGNVLRRFDTQNTEICNFRRHTNVLMNPDCAPQTRSVSPYCAKTVGLNRHFQARYTSQPMGCLLHLLHRHRHRWPWPNTLHCLAIARGKYHCILCRCKTQTTTLSWSPRTTEILIFL